MSYKLIILGPILGVLTGCGINQKEVLPEDGFLKIYNHPEEVLSYFPVGLVELPGGGYLFASAVKDETSEIEYPYTQLVRTDSRGTILWSETYDWLAPSRKLFQSSGSVGFVAMDLLLNAHAVLVDPGSGQVTGQHDLEITVPLAAYTDPLGNLVVLGYDFVSRSSWISKYNADFSLERSTKLPANTDLELLIQRHLNKTGQEFPFFIGAFSNDASSGYFVSCFYNYTLRTVFLDGSSLNATGDLFSFQTDEAVSSLVHKSGPLFGLTGFYEGNNYIVAETEIDVTTSQSILDFPAEQRYELTPRARVVASQMDGRAGEQVLFASQTNSNALVIYQYAMDSDSLIATHYRYFDERVEVSDIIPTADQGVALLARIHILGKYRRPLLVKVPALEFDPESEE
jgi:hypothetical protein